MLRAHHHQRSLGVPLPATVVMIQCRVVDPSYPVAARCRCDEVVPRESKARPQTCTHRGGGRPARHPPKCLESPVPANAVMIPVEWSTR